MTYDDQQVTEAERIGECHRSEGVSPERLSPHPKSVEAPGDVVEEHEEAQVGDRDAQAHEQQRGARRLREAKASREATMSRRSSRGALYHGGLCDNYPGVVSTAASLAYPRGIGPPQATTRCPIHSSANCWPTKESRRMNIWVQISSRQHKPEKKGTEGTVEDDVERVQYLDDHGNTGE